MQCARTRGGARLSQSKAAPAAPSSVAYVLRRAAPAAPSSVEDLLRQILRRHGGSFAFQDIPDEQKNIAPGEETAYSQLNHLYEERELETFVETHCEFACKRVGASTFIYWAGGPALESEIGDESCQSEIDYGEDSDENIL